MRATTGSFLSFLLLVLFSAGCSHYKSLKQDLTVIKSEIDSMKVTLAELDERLSNQNELTRLIRADQQVRFKELKEDMDVVASNITESQIKLSKIDEKTQQLKKGWEEKTRVDSLHEAARIAEMESHYEVARSDYSSGRYAIALGGFQDIVKRFSGTGRAEQSTYWIGECLYAQKKYTEAEESFMDYIKHFPAGDKVCGALLKLGLVYDKKKRVDARDTVWEKLLQQCPGSEEALLAQARMKGK